MEIYLVVKNKNVSAGWNVEGSVLSIAKHERTERILPAYKTKQQAKTYLKKFVETCDRKRYTIIELDLI
jgi:hypothetical protein